MFFTEKNRKKNLIVFFLALPLFCGVVFLTQTHLAYAGVAAMAGDALDLVFKGILLGIFTMIGWIASVAITLFEWVIKPENISGAQGLLNQSVVYEMWKFVRDFFNLFFILVLLYIAFKIVFQIEHDFKKTLLSLVLAALYINFSYPVTRVLIDVTNVPMYFFANQMATGNGSSPGEGGGYTSVFSSAMSASKIKGILIPGADNGGNTTILANSYSRYLIAIVFMFLFAVTLLVLAVMFVIRLVALVILVIFSSVGFAASVVPGLSSYSKMWWESFWKYAFFGPAAMLMLLVSVRFFSALGDEKTGIFKNLTTAAAGNVSSDPTFFASMALFSVPIIMLWMAMGVANKFSIVGASSVVGQGKKFSAWAGKKTYNNPVGRGLYSGGKKVVMEGKVAGLNYGKFPGGKFLTGDYWASPSKTEATIKGGIAGGWGGGAKERQKIKDKQINEQVKKNKEDNLSRSSALEGLKSTDEIKRVANAISLAQMDNGIQNMDDLSKALNALKDSKTGAMNESYREKAVEIVSKADKKIIAATPATATSPAQSGLQNLNTVISAIGKNQKAINDLIDKVDDSAFSGSPVDYGVVRNAVITVNPNLERALESKIRKEGEAKILVDYHIAGGATPSAAVDGVLGSMRSVKDLVASKSLFVNYQAEAVNYVNAQPAARYQEIKKAAAQDSPSVSAMI